MKRYREAASHIRAQSIIAQRARRLVLTARAQPTAKHLSTVDAREDVRRLKTALPKERFARANRIVMRKQQQWYVEPHTRPVREAIENVELSVPPNALNGRRSWIGTTTALGSTKTPAVIVGPLTSTAVKGAALHCWNQNVLYLSRQAQWQASLVCDEKADPGEPKIWFEKYEAKL